LTNGWSVQKHGFLSNSIFATNPQSGASSFGASAIQVMDSQSVYRGKSGEVSSKKGLSYDVVLYLMKDYLDQGPALYVDNFYTSPTLAVDLFGKNTHVTGTLDKTRIGVPEEVHTMLETLCKG